MLVNILIFAGIALGITVAALITLFCVAAAVRSSQLSKQEEDEIDFSLDDIWWMNQGFDPIEATELAIKSRYDRMEYLAELEATRAMVTDLFAKN